MIIFFRNLHCIFKSNKKLFTNSMVCSPTTDVVNSEVKELFPFSLVVMGHFLPSGPETNKQMVYNRLGRVSGVTIIIQKILVTCYCSFRHLGANKLATLISSDIN